MSAERRRRAPLAGLVALLVGGGLGFAGWTVTDDVGPGETPRPAVATRAEAVERATGPGTGRVRATEDAPATGQSAPASRHTERATPAAGPTPGAARAATPLDVAAPPPAPPTTAPPTTAPTTTTPPTTTAQTAVEGDDLPLPEDAPADAHAPTAPVVHGTLALPSLGVEAPLQEGVTLTAIDRGPGHWPGTAMPGQFGNVVVAGHRTTHSRPFHDLDLLHPGDPLVFRMADGAEHTYRHTRTEIVGPDAMHIVTQTPEHRATLFACHPKGSAAQRIVAHFELVG